MRTTEAGRDTELRFAYSRGGVGDPPESAMLRVLLSVCWFIAACAPAPQNTAMTSPTATPVSGPKPGPLTDTPAEALGRRTLSTAFVRLGAGEVLTVELHDGRVLALRDVVMRAKDYCGVLVEGGKFCGGYAAVAAARAGR